jgi:putative transposase
MSADYPSRPPDWYSSEISEQINLPREELYDNKIYNKNFLKLLLNDINFGESRHNNKFTSYSQFIRTEYVRSKGKFDFQDLPVVDITKEKAKLEVKLKKVIKNINLRDIKQADKNTKIKTAQTKNKKSISNINTVTICERITVYPTKKQVDILAGWYMECSKVYNKCVDLYTEDNHYFDEGYMKVKVKIFKLIYGEDDKDAPYDVLTDEVKTFCANLKSAETNLENDNIKHFTFKHKNIEKGQCLFIPKVCVKETGLYPSLLGKMKGTEQVNFKDVKQDCRLLYDKIGNIYTLLIPKHIKITKIPKRQPIVALDPGEKIFLSFFGLNDFGQIGIDMRVIILMEEKKIRRFERISRRRKNKKGKNLTSNKLTKLKQSIDKCYKRIKNIVKELHNKAALYLCKRYDRILIPEFKTQQMLSNKPIAKGKGKGQLKVTETYETKGYKKGYNELKKYRKGKKLNKRVKFVLGMLSHYRFRKHLINKGNEYGCKIEVVTEEYTSKACTCCGDLGDDYEGRIKTCIRCDYRIDRDINGSRNILIKNISPLLKQKG